MVQPDAEPEAQSEPGPQRGAEPDPQLGLDPDAQSDVESEAQALPDAGPQPDADSDAQPDSNAQPDADAQPDFDAQLDADAGVDALTQPGAYSESQPDADSEVGVRSGSEAGFQGESRSEGKAAGVTGSGDGGLFDVPAAVVTVAPAVVAVPAAVEMSDVELRGAVEAILLIVDEPATEMILAQVLDQPVDRIRGVLEDVARQYTSLGLGFDLRRVAGGWRLYTRAEFAPYVEKFVLDGQQIRLTQAALETLAVVAYKQPVTRSRISAIRGVNCDGVVRTLVTRGLIEETGSEPESGAFLYRTTSLFLEKLGLDSVDQLPPLAPFLPDDIDEIADAQR